MNNCITSEHYQEKDLTGMSPFERLQSVSGFCMDSDNPDFNEWAKKFGRGICREDSYTNPKWCSKRENPEKTEEYYTKDEISEAVEQEVRYRKLVEFIKFTKSNSITWN